MPESVSRLKSRLKLWLRARRARLTQKSIIRASGLFDESWYLRRNPDVAAARTHPFNHYWKTGSAEGRNPMPLFDPSWYRSQTPDVAASGMEAFAHFLFTGWKELRNPHPLFHTGWYLGGESLASSPL
jgi:hypothetical protein